MTYTVKRKSGRTIADLIAISCILVVVGILVQPILARSRTSSGCTCQSNLKQLWKAFSLYINDYDATLPSSYLYGRSRTWAPDDFVRFAKEQGSLPPPPGAIRRSWPMVLFPYVVDRGSLWCPSDRSPCGNPTARISYYWKAAVDRAWYGDSSVGVFRKEGDFIYPGHQILLYEHSGWHYGRRNLGLTDGVAINCAFMDGHVGGVEVRDSGYARKENPPEPLPASGVGEPAWFNYSIGDNSPRFHKGRNWDPTIWADNMKELPSRCDAPVVTCQDNLRKLAVAVLMYADDWDDDMPSSYLNGHSSTWNADNFVWFAGRRGILPPPSQATRLSWPMVFYSYLTSDRVLWCPSDAGRSGEPSVRVSYYWKAAVDAAWYGGPDGVGPEVRNRNEYLFPADQIVFYERNGWHGRRRGGGLADGAMINCAFIDGHVSLYTIQDSGYRHGELPAEPLPSSGEGEPAWFNYSFGAATPERNKGRNWNPTIWGDALR